MPVTFGIALPNCTEGLCYPTGFASPEVVIRFAQAAERLGYDSAWCNDHFTTQQYVRQALARPAHYYEPLITLMAVAGATQRIRLGTCVTVVPLREPVLLAKQVATLDVFCGGRFIFGVGVGAYREEFLATYPDRADANRGAIHAEGLPCVMFTTQQFPLAMKVQMAVYGTKLVAVPTIQDRWRMVEACVGTLPNGPASEPSGFSGP